MRVFVTPLKDQVDYGVKLKKVRGEFKALTVLTNIESAGGVKQCRIQNFQHINAGGYLPTAVVDNRLPDALKIGETERGVKRKAHSDILTLLSRFASLVQFFSVRILFSAMMRLTALHWPPSPTL